ncbi:MAG: hypothetical protein COA45_12430 [Zetaproteobacteria bacterium]|nr:MAG: hypothetical protein COA45_12430 [Zetaproteobacteria bacterium]
MKYFYLLPLIFLSACATPYQQQSFSGGFSETQLSENVFQVSFEGNGYTNKQRASDFALLRSAELALENGYDYFAITGSENSVDVSSYTTPLTAHTTGHSNTYGTLNTYGNYGTYSGSTYGSSSTYFTGGDTTIINKPNSNITVVMFKKKPKDIFVLDANFLSTSLKAKYKMQPKPEPITETPPLEKTTG